MILTTMKMSLRNLWGSVRKKEMILTLDELRDAGLVYLATPYTKYPQGIGMAYRHAAKIAGRLIGLGVRVFSPVCHSHPMAVYGEVAPLNHEFWLDFDQTFMERSDVLLVARMETWEKSFGIAREIRVFKEAAKPIYYLEPSSLLISNAA